MMIVGCCDLMGALPFLFEEWDSTVVSRVGFLADSCIALVHGVHR